MNTVEATAFNHGRSYITPSDVTEALSSHPEMQMQVCLDVLETIGTQREFGILSSFGCAAIAAAKIKELRDDPAVQAAISDKVVARQAREIYDLTDRLTDYEKSATKIRNILYCIGGPLNDNKQGYTRQQLKPFLDIANLVDVE